MTSRVPMNMSSSSVNPAYPEVSGNLGHCETMLGSPTTSQSHLFAERPAQPQGGAPDVKRPCNDHCSRIMEDIDPNQRYFETPSPNDAGIHSVPSLPEGFPPVMQHLSLYASRAAPKFQPRQPGDDTPTALEHRFTMKNILKRNEADISLIDVHQVCLLQGQYHKSHHTYKHNNRAKRLSSEA
jgi:hypothetical protein